MNLSMLRHSAAVLIGRNGDSPEVSTWDGSRDYSFYSEGRSTYHVKTPSQYAALCYITNGLWDGDEYNRGHVSATDSFAGKTVTIDNDLVFNDDYESNKSWMDLYTDDGKVYAPTNDCTLLRLSFGGTLDGQLHSLKGLFYHYNIPNPTYESGKVYNYLSSSAVVKDLYIEHCSAKSYKQGAFAFFSVADGVQFLNVQVRGCRVVALTQTSGGSGSVQYSILATVGTGTNVKLTGCSIVDSDCKMSDPTGYSSYRYSAAMLGCWNTSGRFDSCFMADVSATIPSGYDFSRSAQSLARCCKYNVSGVSTYNNVVTASSYEGLVSKHNENVAAQSSGARKINSLLRYV